MLIIQFEYSGIRNYFAVSYNCVYAYTHTHTHTHTIYIYIYIYIYRSCGTYRI